MVSAMTARLRLKRAYDVPDEGDGRRVLVDRLWPRGLSKDAARIDVWAKALAPSARLRKEAHADPGFPDEAKSWARFCKEYRRELGAQEGEAEDRREALETIRAALRQGPVTLLYALKATSEERNNAAALREWLKEVL